jgi:predicted O-methyltransferase YrrM
MNSRRLKMRIMDNAANIILGKAWKFRPLFDSFLYGSIGQRSFMNILFQKKKNRCSTLKDCVSLAFSTFNIKPMQIREEITELLQIVAANKPRFVLEVGTARGGTLFLLSRVASPNASIISLDLPSGDFGGGYSSQKIPFFKTFAVQGQRIYFVRENSHLIQTFHLVEGILKENKLDLLFIDGDHTYNGVKKDFEMYSKLVKKGGMIALHDICVHSGSGCDVEKFWREIKVKYTHLDIIKDTKQGWAGIGVLHINQST